MVSEAALRLFSTHDLIHIMVYQQCHKPMTGNGNHTTYNNLSWLGDDLLMFMIVLPTLIYIYIYCLVVWNMNLMTFHILGMSSSQLTFISFRGVGQPPTSIYIHNIIWYNMNIQWRQRPWRHVFVDGLVRWKDLAISSKKTDKTCHLICLSPSSRWVHSSNLISINLSCDVQCLMTMGSEWLYKNAAFVSQSISSWVVQKIVEVVDG